MNEWMVEFWGALPLALLLVAASLGIGSMVGYDRGRSAGIRAEREDAERRRRVRALRPPHGHSGASDVVERCRARGGCCS